MAQLKALYFPYAQMRLETLKEAALYFDEVYCIDPESMGGRPGTVAGVVEPTAEPSELSELWELVNANVCRAVRPEEVRSQWDDLLAESVAADLQDKRYVQLCARSRWQSWSLAETKMGGDLVHDLVDLARDVPRHLPAGVREWIEDRVTFSVPEFSEGVHMGMDVRYVNLPFVLGESILVNLAMCACAELDASPLTDDRFHYLVLKAKYARARQDPDLSHLLATEGIIQSATEQALVREVMRSTLPAVGDLPAGEVLRIRDKLKSQLDDFRVEMGLVAGEIEEKPWDQAFEARVKQMVNTRLRPRLRALKWDLQGERDRYWMEQVPADVTKVARSGWLTSVLTGTPGAGVILAAGKSLVNVASGWLGHRRQDRALKRNGLTYLVELRRAYA